MILVQQRLQRVSATGGLSANATHEDEGPEGIVGKRCADEDEQHAVERVAHADASVASLQKANRTHYIACLPTHTALALQIVRREALRNDAVRVFVAVRLEKGRLEEGVQVIVLQVLGAILQLGRLDLYSRRRFRVFEGMVPDLSEAVSLVFEVNAKRTLSLTIWPSKKARSSSESWLLRMYLRKDCPKPQRSVRSLPSQRRYARARAAS
jgi:hypothetical protein